MRPERGEFHAEGRGRYTGGIIGQSSRSAPGTNRLPTTVPAVVPVLELKPDVLSRWATLVSGSSTATRLAAATLTGAAGNPRSTRRGQEPTADGTADPTELVRAFRASVSAESYRLAGFFSAAAPLTLPVMRLVQESALSEQDRRASRGISRRTAPPLAELTRQYS